MRGVRTYLVGILITGSTILAAGCGFDVTTQPAQQDQQPTRPITPNPLALHSTVGPLPTGQYNASVKFTIDPNSDAYIAIGPHYLYIPAAAVCDPMTSGYGTLTWSLPCVPASRPIVVNAKSYLKNGHPVVEFDTPLRFRPSSDARYDVMLYLRDDHATSASTIRWCPETADYCVDESSSVLLGSQPQTRFDPAAFYVYRKIQHFSGYNVTGGEECDPNVDPTCGGGL